MYVTKLNRDFFILPSREENPIIEIIFVTRGYLILDSNFNCIRINPLELHLSVAQSPGTLIETSDDINGWYCRFSSEFINTNFYREDLIEEIEVISSFLCHYPLRLTKKVYERISSHFAAINQLMNEEIPDLLLVNTYLLACIYEVRKLIKESVLDFYPAKAFSIVKRYNDLLVKHLEHKYEIGFYAEELNISSNHLNKSVKIVLGKTAIGLLNEKRVLKAKTKLQFTDLSISEIALQLGFIDQSYFSRFFKKRVRKTPLEYRKCSR